MADEFRTLRSRQKELADAMDRRPEKPDPQVSQVGLVYNAGSIPTTVPKYFAVHPATVGGAEGEGLTPTFDVATGQTLYFAVLGPRVPVAGDYLVADSVSGRWVAQNTGASPYNATLRLKNIQGCGCALNGATVTITNATLGFSATVTTDASGNTPFVPVYCDLLSVYTWTITAPGYLAKTSSIQVGPFSFCAIDLDVTSGYSAMATDPDYWCFGGTPTPYCKGLIPAQVYVTFGSTADDVYLFGSVAGTTQTIPKVIFGTQVFQHSITGITGSNLALQGTAVVHVVYFTQGTCVAPDSVSVSFVGSTIDPLVNPTIAMPRTSGTGACPVAFSASGTFVGGSPSFTIYHGSCTVSE